VTWSPAFPPLPTPLPTQPTSRPQRPASCPLTSPPHTISLVVLFPVQFRPHLPRGSNTPSVSARLFFLVSLCIHTCLLVSNHDNSRPNQRCKSLSYVFWFGFKVPFLISHISSLLLARSSQMHIVVHLQIVCNLHPGDRMTQPSTTHTRSSKLLPPTASPETNETSSTQTARWSAMAPLESSFKQRSSALQRRARILLSRRSCRTSASRSVPLPRTPPFFFANPPNRTVNCKS